MKIGNQLRRIPFLTPLTFHLSGILEEKHKFLKGNNSVVPFLVGSVFLRELDETCVHLRKSSRIGGVALRKQRLNLPAKGAVERILELVIFLVCINSTLRCSNICSALVVLPCATPGEAFSPIPHHNRAVLARFLIQ